MADTGVTSPDDIRAYVKQVVGGDTTVKDFRTWHGTVLAAVALAVSTHAAETPTARKRAVARAMREVSEYLGNTPAVTRASYVDPRVVDLFEDGITIERALGELGDGTAGLRAGDPRTHRTGGAAAVDDKPAGTCAGLAPHGAGCDRIAGPTWKTPTSW